MLLERWGVVLLLLAILWLTLALGIAALADLHPAPTPTVPAVPPEIPVVVPTS